MKINVDMMVDIRTRRIVNAKIQDEFPYAYEENIDIPAITNFAVEIIDYLWFKSEKVDL